MADKVVQVVDLAVNGGAESRYHDAIVVVRRRRHVRVGRVHQRRHAVHVDRESAPTASLNDIRPSTPRPRPIFWPRDALGPKLWAPDRTPDQNPGPDTEREGDGDRDRNLGLGTSMAGWATKTVAG